jgi:hypothetical protein
LILSVVLPSKIIGGECTKSQVRPARRALPEAQSEANPKIVASKAQHDKIKNSSQGRKEAMAFDHPLEADKVDDLGLFSTLVRAPVVGIIMWALGGHDAKKREEEDQKRFVKEQLEGECPISSEERPIYTAELQKMIEQNRNKKMGKKMPPRMIGSDLSDFGDLSIHPSETDLEEKENDSQMGSNRLKRAKKMSWSDESGQSLCEYLDEVSEQ